MKPETFIALAKAFDTHDPTMERTVSQLKASMQRHAWNEYKARVALDAGRAEHHSREAEFCARMAQALTDAAAL